MLDKYSHNIKTEILTWTKTLGHMKSTWFLKKINIYPVHTQPHKASSHSVSPRCHMVWFRWRLIAVVVVVVVVVLQTTKNSFRPKQPTGFGWFFCTGGTKNQEPRQQPAAPNTTTFPSGSGCDPTAHLAAWCVQVHCVLLQHFLYALSIVNIIFCNISFSPIYTFSLTVNLFSAVWYQWEVTCK